MSLIPPISHEYDDSVANRKLKMAYEDEIIRSDCIDCPSDDVSSCQLLITLDAHEFIRSRPPAFDIS
jgi:hypothetical protein